MVKDLLLLTLFIVVIFKYVMLYRDCLKQRNYFINTLSHDLRVSTIAQIRGLELLEKSPSPELICEIKKSCEFTFDMLNMLLNTYKYQNGEQILNLEKTNFQSLISSICNFQLPLATEKEVRLQILENQNCEVNIDRLAINKTLKLLITTAINNAKKGSSVFLSTKKNNKTIITSIFYIGKPLSEEEYNRMFLENPRFSTVGYGIKMQFCKKIIDFHKGKLSFEKHENGLNSFTIQLPINKKSKEAENFRIRAFQTSNM